MHSAHVFSSRWLRWGGCKLKRGNFILKNTQEGHIIVFQARKTLYRDGP